MNKVLLIAVLMLASHAFAESKFEGNLAHLTVLKGRSLLCSYNGIKDNSGYIEVTEDVNLYAFNNKFSVKKILRKTDGKTYSIQTDSTPNVITCVANTYLFENSVCYEIQGETRKQTDIKNCTYGGYNSAYGQYGYGYNGLAYGPCVGHFQNFNGQTDICRGYDCSGMVLKNLQTGVIQQCQ